MTLLIDEATFTFVKVLLSVIVAKHRSRSADTCTLRRPTQEAMKLVERLVDVNTHGPPSEYESDVAAVRLSVATSQMEDFDPVTPPLPAKVSDLCSAKSRQASRAKMNLSGLIPCRPQMPTPSCGPFVTSVYADATGMSICDLIAVFKKPNLNLLSNLILLLLLLLPSPPLLPVANNVASSL